MDYIRMYFLELLVILTLNVQPVTGSGKITTSKQCSHGLWSTHSYCVHNQTSKHDN